MSTKMRDWLFSVVFFSIMYFSLVSGRCGMVTFDVEENLENSWLEDLTGEEMCSIAYCSKQKCEAKILVGRLKNTGGFLNDIEQNFVRNKKSEMVFIHLSDEQQSHGPMLNFIRHEYAQWKAVFRNYFDPGYDDMQHVYWFPLGYAKKKEKGIDWIEASKSELNVQASKRKNTACFIGNQTNRKRKAWIKKFEDETGIKLYPGGVQNTAFGKGDEQFYVDTMLNCQFCLALPGFSIETFRTYEALQAGCIPVLLDEWLEGKQWHKLQNPGIYVNKIDDLLDLDNEIVDDLQKKVVDLWEKEKAHHKSLMYSLISRSSKHEEL